LSKVRHSLKKVTSAVQADELVRKLLPRSNLHPKSTPISELECSEQAFSMQDLGEYLRVASKIQEMFDICRGKTVDEMSWPAHFELLSLGLGIRWLPEE
jgi:hypothetical protein